MQHILTKFMGGGDLLLIMVSLSCRCGHKFLACALIGRKETLVLHCPTDNRLLAEEC